MGHVVFLNGWRSHILSHSPRSPCCHRTVDSRRVLLQRDGTLGSLIVHVDVLAGVSWSQRSEEAIVRNTRFLWTLCRGGYDILIVLTSFGQVGNMLVCFVPDLDYLGDLVALEMVKTNTLVTWAKESQD